MVTGAGHSTTSEKSSPYLHQGMTLTHMVPDLARSPNSLGGKLLFGASEGIWPSGKIGHHMGQNPTLV